MKAFALLSLTALLFAANACSDSEAPAPQHHRVAKKLRRICIHRLQAPYGRCNRVAKRWIVDLFSYRLLARNSG